MLIDKKLLYFELQKTGSTHTRKILKEFCGEEAVIFGKHNTYDSIPSAILGEFEKKIKIGNIRNPWDWYVSLWAFGCMGKGTLHRVVVQPQKKASLQYFKNRTKKLLGLLDPQKYEWEKVYSNSRKPENFRRWLKMVVSSESLPIGEGYKESPFFPSVGLLTYRYLRLYSYQEKVSECKDMDYIKNYDKRNNFMDIIIRNEAIHEDLLKYRPLLGGNEVEMKMLLDSFSMKTNKSMRVDYRKYYDTETRKLVEQKEKFLIEKYDYTFH